MGPGSLPAASVAAFMRVKVGNAAWLFASPMPPRAAGARSGCRQAVMASGRSPSTMQMMTRCGAQLWPRSPCPLGLV